MIAPHDNVYDFIDAAPLPNTAEDFERPTIQVVPGDLPHTVDSAERVLIESGVSIYQQGGRLVTISQDGPDDKIRRQPGAPRITVVSPILIRETLTRHAVWTKYDARTREWRSTDCPMTVAASLCERACWQFPELVGYIEAPTLREDGSPLTAHGFDSESGLFLAHNAPRIALPAPDMLTREAAINAADTLLCANDSFPFVSSADRVAAVAMLLSGILGRSIPATPMTAVSAPTPGTGKSLLADGAAILATGRTAAVMSLGRDSAEAEKRLTGAMLAGDSIIHLDNVERPLEGDLVCQVITQPAISVRPLGGSAMVRVPARTALIATGNNLTVRGDLTRRVMLIRLDAGMERPETRQFERNYLDDIRTQRRELIAAALTIPLAYHLAGCPPVPNHTPFGSFDAWDRMVRRPIMWLGLDDPLTPAEMLREDDPDRSAMRSLFNAWHAAFGDKAVTAATVVDHASRSGPRFDGQGREYEHADLHDALEQIAGDKPNARQLGYALRRYRGRRVDGLVLEASGSTGHAKVQGWRIRAIERISTARR